MDLEGMIAQFAAWIAAKWAATSTTDLIWHSIGMIGQCMFFMRFVVQWFASEKQKRSIVPDAFWYWSIAGGSIVLVYSIYQLNPVFILAQGSGLFIYFRNIYFIRRNKRMADMPSQAECKAAAE
jgi:lipid-A-disaccharide synthase-like uncharacterized protein